MRGQGRTVDRIHAAPECPYRLIGPMRIACALGALLSLLLAGCSATEQETTTVTTTVTAEPDAGVQPEPAAKGPYGVMGPRVFGPISIGVNENAVRAQFGMPDKTEDVNFGDG